MEQEKKETLSDEELLKSARERAKREAEEESHRRAARQSRIVKKIQKERITRELLRELEDGYWKDALKETVAETSDLK